MKSAVIIVVVLLILGGFLLFKGDGSTVSVSSEEAPSVQVEIEKDPVGGWNVFVETDKFEFTPENVGGEHVLGEGYGELQLDGKKIARMYGSAYHIGSIPEGQHEVSVVLNSNDHRPYAVSGNIVSDSESVSVSEPKMEMEMKEEGSMEMDHDSMEMDHDAMEMEMDDGHMMEDGAMMKDDEMEHEMEMENHAHMHDSTVMAGPNMSVSIEVFEDSVEGWNVKISTSGFEFAPRNASLAHVAGEGHAHIYEDGVKLGRVYTEWYHLASLTPGSREVLVNLNSNDHTPYTTHSGARVEDSETVEVSGLEDFKTSAKSFNVSLSERSQSPEIITVTQGDNVVLNVIADEMGEYHIAGYEIKKDMNVDGVTEIVFVADKAGRYNLELHPHDSDDDLEIGALVVNPK